MKKQFFLATAMAVAFGMFALTAQAQQEVDGSAGVNTLGLGGDSNNGGLNETSGGGTYVGTSTPGISSGYVNTAGAGASNTHVGATKSSATSSSNLSLSLGTQGGPGSELTTLGNSAESAWTNAPSSTPTNYASSSVGTNSSLNGTVTDTPGGNPLSSEGTAASNGKSFSLVKLSPDGFTATTVAKTVGTSNGTETQSGGTPTLNSSVGGASGAGSGESVTGPGVSFSNGFGQAGGSYYGVNPNGSSVGLTQADVSSTSTVCPTGSCAAASSSASSTNQVKNY